MSDDATISTLPVKLALDLDAAEKRPDEVYEDFTFKHAGRSITMLDPSDLDWTDLLLLRQPSEFIRLCMTRDDYHFFLENKMPGWKFNRLLESFEKHFELEEKVEAAEKKARLAGLQSV